jgi:hypothetical protein
MKQGSESASLVPAATFVVCLLSVIFAPLLVLVAYESGYVNKILTSIQNWMFFGPQYLLPINTYTAARGGEHVNPLIWVLTWIVVVVLFSWFCRRLNLGASIIAAFGTIAFTTFAMHAVIACLGWHFYLDGP